MSSENKFYHKWWFWVILSVIILGVIGGAFSNSTNQDTNQNDLENINEESLVQEETPIIESSKSWHEVITFSGTGDKNTDAFNIKGDKFRITYTVDAANDYSILTLFVYPEGENLYAETLMTDVGFSGTDSTILYEGAGNYYLDIGAGNLNSWSMKVEDYY